MTIDKRRHPDAGSFRKAWEAALALGIQQLEDAAMDRALHGVDVPVYSYGKLVGTRTIYNERLVMFMLRNRAPTRFAGDGRAGARRSAMGDPAEANRLSRLKRQWRQEWEAERAAEDEREDAEVTAQLQAQLESIHANRQAALTRRTRALYETARLAEAEDLAAQRFGFDEDDEEEEGEDGYGDGDADRAAFSSPVASAGWPERSPPSSPRSFPPEPAPARPGPPDARPLRPDRARAWPPAWPEPFRAPDGPARYVLRKSGLCTMP